MTVAVLGQRNGARQRFDAGGRTAAEVTRRGDRAHDIGFDDDVGRAADHQQMLDIVAPHQNEPAAAVDAGVIDHGKPRLAAARAGAAEPAGAEPAHRPGGDADEPEHDQKGEEEANGERHLRPEQCIKHPHNSPFRTGAPMIFQRLTARVTFAAVITNKALKILADFRAKADASSIVMVNGGLMAKPPQSAL